MTAPAPTTPKRAGILSARFGPLPVGIWLLLLVAGILIWVWWKNRNSSDDSGEASVFSNPSLHHWPNSTVPVTATSPASNNGTTTDTGTGTDTPVDRTQTISYKVKSGDTLDKIAAQFGVSRADLYAKNASVIEATAKAHGLESSSKNGQQGWWIWPETPLTIIAPV